MSAGLPAVLGLAAGAFAGTNVDNAAVTVAMIAAAPAERAKRISLGQAIGSSSSSSAPSAWPCSSSLLRHAEGRSRVGRRAIGSGVLAATMITIGAGGDNLAVYIPLFRVAGFGGTAASLLVFAVGEVILTLFVLRAGRHPHVPRAVTAIGVFAAPVLHCAIGILVLVEAGTLSFLRKRVPTRRG